MKKIGLLITIALFGIQCISAQSSKVSTAYFLMDDYQQSKSTKDILKAKEAIDAASEHETTSTQGKTWYYKGLIYRMLAKDETTKTDAVDYSAIALSSFSKALSVNDKRFRDDDKVIQIFNEMAVDAFNGGVAAYGKQDFAKAYTLFNNTLEVNEILKENGAKEPVSSIDAVKNAAISADYAGKTSEAIEAYEKLIPLDSKHNHYFNLALLYKKAENNEKYVSTLEKGSKAFPDDANIIIEQLNILIKAGKTSEAMDKIDKAIELQPDNDMLYFVKGNSLEKVGKIEEALVEYQNAADKNPKNDKALYNIGAVYFKKANKIIEEMNKLTMSAADTKKYEALNAERKEIYKKAKPYFEKVIELVPTDAASKKALNKINATLNN